MLTFIETHASTTGLTNTVPSLSARKSYYDFSPFINDHWCDLYAHGHHPAIFDDHSCTDLHVLFEFPYMGNLHDRVGAWHYRLWNVRAVAEG